MTCLHFPVNSQKAAEIYFLLQAECMQSMHTIKEKETKFFIIIKFYYFILTGNTFLHF